MSLSLADFDCAAARLPLPADKWDDVLAVSVLPGPLDSLCVRMARQPDAWMAWYESVRPETEPLPAHDGDGPEGATTQGEEEGDSTHTQQGLSSSALNSTIDNSVIQ